METSWEIREQLQDSEAVEYLSVYLNHHPASFTIDLYKYTYYRLLRVIPKNPKDLQYVRKCEEQAKIKARGDEGQDCD
jgi:spore coat polysaccharide biosynthesis protein SpsF (cytidylyltransferase family)